jgi:predicted ATPase
MSPRFIERVKIKNYKSIKECDIELQDLTFLVGPNGSGKSNFLDAIKFVSDAIRIDLDYAFSKRGSFMDVLRKNSIQNNNMQFEFKLNLKNDIKVFYFVKIEFEANNGYFVAEEFCQVDFEDKICFFEVKNRQIKCNININLPAFKEKRFYLSIISFIKEFEIINDFFENLEIYNINPDIIRKNQDPSSEYHLRRQGENITSILKNTPSKYLKWIEEFMDVMTLNATPFKVISLGNKEMLEFTPKKLDNKMNFYANNMSEGTLRILGILTALFQQNENESKKLNFVGIEEPEAALHPWAVGALLDAFRIASDQKQVIVASHSPELLDRKDININSLLIVNSINGETIIGPMGKGAQSILKERICTAGELLRQNQLEPDTAA